MMPHSQIPQRLADDDAGPPCHLNHSGHPAATLTDSADSPTARPTVLVVEDEPGVAAVERMLLEQAGFIVLLSDNGTTGWELAQRYLLAAVVLDVDLPGLNGCEVCQRLRASPATRHLPVLICSGSEIARVIGRTRTAVQQRRLILNIPLAAPKIRPWTEAELRHLGKKLDPIVAQMTGRSLRAVRLKRFKMGMSLDLV